MTSRTQLPIEVLPNQIRARYPGPAAATCLTPAHHQAGPAARLPLSHPAQGHPQTPQSRSQPGARGYMGSSSTRGTPTGSWPMWLLSCCQIPPVLLFLPCPLASPSPIPFQPSPGPVWSVARSLSRLVLSMDGLDGLMRDFFSLVLRPLPTWVPRRCVSPSASFREMTTQGTCG